MTRLSDQKLRSPNPKRSAVATGAESSPGAADFDLQSQIDAAYRAIGTLNKMPKTPAREKQIKLAFSRLRELQHREAELFQQQFEKNLRMPINAGAKILDRSRVLRMQLEDLASPDRPAPTTVST